MATVGDFSREYPVFGTEPEFFPPGARFGPRERYEVVGELGRGSSAIVLKVSDTERGIQAAAKLMRSRDGEKPDDALNRARAEMFTLERLDHENIVRAYEAGPCGETAYLLLEYQEGVGLDRLAETGALSVERALDVTLELAGALEHAHARGVLHLDVKPSNVWISNHGPAKLLDFGIDAELEDLRREAESTPILIAGTPAYMAPEQWLLITPDARADVWALGVTLYELLTGDMPFAESGTHPVLLCDAVVASKSPPAVSDRLDAPRALDEVLRRALANDRKQRFQTARDFRQALEDVSRDLRSYCPSSTRARRTSATAVA